MGRNLHFHFKKFSIYQKESAFKVGTDSVILGAWADFSKCKNLLDIGTGTGVLSLILASRFSQIAIKAIELDQKSAEEAQQNFNLSSFHDRIQFIHSDILSWSRSQIQGSFDGIISNPPYFENDLRNPDVRIANARHTIQLNYIELIKNVEFLLTQEGRFYFILPAIKLNEVINITQEHDLYINHILSIRNKPHQSPIRVICLIQKIKKELINDELCIRGEDGKYSKEYIHLTKDLYQKDLS